MRTRSLDAQAKQANEHGEKQNDISDGSTDAMKFDDLEVAWQAEIRRRSP
jgi:hypothetical protein